MFPWPEPYHGHFKTAWAAADLGEADFDLHLRHWFAYGCLSNDGLAASELK